MHCQLMTPFRARRRRQKSPVVLLSSCLYLVLLTVVVVLSCWITIISIEVAGVAGFPIGGAGNDVRSKSLPPPMLPTDPEAMLRQASLAITRAFEAGNDTTTTTTTTTLHRQTIRLPLSESMYGTKEESFVADRAIGWQGGPQEIFRYVSPMAQQLLKSVVSSSSKGGTDATGLVPKLQEQILLDFDGSSLLNAQSPLGPLRDGIGLVQPNTDQYYMDLIQTLEDDFSDTPNKAKRLFLLINPSWKENDANAWGFFQRKFATTTILERYETTYAIDQFIVKGNKLSLLKAYPCDWCVYYTPLRQPGSTESPPPPVLLGTFPERPKYDQIEELTQKGF